jgi:ADP-ribosyl-[dinitrogen reductase] hydrolase
MITSHTILSGLMGVCVGDALGVPVEFTSRQERIISPVTTMVGYGTYNQPPGTWSDDSSLTFCLAESLCNGYCVDDIAKSFVLWYTESYWTAHGQVFDIGNATRQAIYKFSQGTPALTAGGTSENSNGNGSLMRILPMAFLHETVTFCELIDQVHQVSAITHGHLRSQMACGIYISIAVELLKGANLFTAYHQGINNIQKIYSHHKYLSEINNFQRVLNGDIKQLPIEAINSSGYVVDTLEAALWCILNSSSYSEAVLKAVNLGEDTDTTGAVTGGLAGIYYGVDHIPIHWIEQIARKQDIVNLANRLSVTYSRTDKLYT